MDKLLLTPTEAAHTLGIGRSKLYELMRAGVVPSVRIGACRRIVAAELSRLIERLAAHHEDGRARPERALARSRLAPAPCPPGCVVHNLPDSVEPAPLGGAASS